MNKLFWYHTAFWLFYYLWALNNGSDSMGYYRGSAFYPYPWLDLYETGTPFIKFLALPFTKTLGFSYESAMFLFAWFGYLGFVYFYTFFMENSRVSVKFWGYDLITLLLFLPNMHYWTASLGKGGLTFLALGMFAYAMKFPYKRLFPLILGSMIVYHIRPHMFLFLGFGAAFGYFTGRDKVPMYQKILVSLAFVGAIAVFYDKIIGVASLNEEDLVGSFEDFTSHRAFELGKSSSGVDLNSYPLPLKLFTFWFRPLFVDAPGMMGIFSSVENLFYLFLTFKLFDKDFFGFLRNSTSLVKMSLTIFLGASVALSFVMANLGIALRQKSMVMYFLFFVIMAFLEFKKRKSLSYHVPTHA